MKILVRGMRGKAWQSWQGFNDLTPVQAKRQYQRQYPNHTSIQVAVVDSSEFYKAMDLAIEAEEVGSIANRSV